MTSLRDQLASVKTLLETTPIARDSAAFLAEQLQAVSSRIEVQPQLAAVRPATIALHNLIVSLRRPDVSADLATEREAALEALADLLEDATFGIDSETVRAHVASALADRGIHACPACRQPDLAIEPVYMLMKPFPSDPELAPSQLPCAILVCKRCGFMWMHDLAILGAL